jgi:DNA (cytosine-5)-methyltransferase 1
MKVASLFAGCGGLDLGLIQAGHKIVYAHDIDKDCTITYKKNIGDHIVKGDIYDLNGDDIPEFDLLTGGFPCQGFSIANLYRHEKDVRNALYVQLVRIIKETHPKYFLAENVPGILNLGGGEVVKVIDKEFSNIGKNSGYPGYDVKRVVVVASNYGVPQNRKRVLWLGASKLIEKENREIFLNNFPPKITNSNDQELNQNTEPLKTLKNAIKDLPEQFDNTIPNHHGTKHKVKINGYIGNRILDWDKPGPTIVGRGGGTGGPVIPVHPNLKRRFSVRETARIQSFPDEFLFEGSISSQYRQIGNAVPVLLAYHLGKYFRDFENGKLDNYPYQKSIY